MSRHQIAVALVVVSLVATGLQAARPAPVDAQGRPLYQPGVVAVKVSAATAPALAKALPGGFGEATLDAVAKELRVTRVEPMFRTRLAKSRPDLPDLTRILRVELPSDADVVAAARRFAAEPGVEYAEPVPMRYVEEVPDDPMYSQQFHLPQIEAPAAWDVHKGEEGATVVVGIADSGVAWRHEDLVDNIHQNLGEDADGDGHVIEQSGGQWVLDPGDLNDVDDDGNGYVDDLVGWDFLADGGGQDNDPDDSGSHGTHVAGIAAARTGNGVGVASVSWNVEILPTSTANADSGTALPRALNGVVYLAENGADIINMSFGGASTAQVEEDVMEYASGLGSLLVAAAGNENTAAAHYPSALPDVVSVASVGRSDFKASYSNYGLSVDVAAPGGTPGFDIESTLPTGYGGMQGTSMASPVAAGLFALLKSQRPGWDNDRLIRQVLAAADPIDDNQAAYAGQLGSGRINALTTVGPEASVANPTLKLELVDVELLDATGDGSLQAGETARLRIDLRNYSHLAGTAAATLTLRSSDPLIHVLDATETVPIDTDSTVVLDQAFEIQADADAPSGQYQFTLEVDAVGAEVSPVSTLDIGLMVANGGVLVWEGRQDATFSGRWLADQLTDRGFEVVLVRGDFPSGLVGFDAVFLSFGNAGDGSFAARLDTPAKVEAIRSYLEDGGRLYLEGGDTLGFDVLGNLVDGEILLPLFGLSGGEDGETNEIDQLQGQPGALTEGMVFTASSQDPVEWIDLFTPGGGTAAFEESGYGIVAVQHHGLFGQRTFCFSYAIADLTDGTTTRSDLLDAIVAYFRLVTAEDRMRPRRGGTRVMPR